MVLVVSAILAGCTTGSAPTVAPATGADPGGVPATTGPTVVDGDPSGAPATTGPIATPGPVSGVAVEVTSENGFLYRITVLDRPTKVASFHAAGYTLDVPSLDHTAPVGSFYVALHVKIENLTTDRPEPIDELLNAPGGGGRIVGPGLIFATTKSVVQQVGKPLCIAGIPYWLPDGLCALSTAADSDSETIYPSDYDVPDDQIPAGASLTVTLVAAEPMGGATEFVGLPDKTLDSTLLSADPSMFQLYYTSAESAISIPIPPGAGPSGAPATTGPIATPGPVSGGGVEVTSKKGFLYRITVLDRPTKVASFHAASISPPVYTAPVGNFFLHLHVKIENLATDRPEPLSELLDTDGDGSILTGGLRFATTKSVVELIFSDLRLVNACSERGRSIYLPDDLCPLVTAPDRDSVHQPGSDEIPAGGSLTVILVAAEPMAYTVDMSQFVGLPEKTLDSTLLSADPSVFQLYYASAESVISIPIPPG